MWRTPYAHSSSASGDAAITEYAVAEYSTCIRSFLPARASDVDAVDAVHDLPKISPTEGCGRDVGHEAASPTAGHNNPKRRRLSVRQNRREEFVDIYDQFAVFDFSATRRICRGIVSSSARLQNDTRILLEQMAPYIQNNSGVTPP